MILREMVERDARSLSHEALAELRRRAVGMVVEGHSQRAVARMLDVHEVTVSKWMRALRERGEALFEAKEAPGVTG